MLFLTCEVGIRKDEVVAEGEGEVLKGDVGIRKDEVFLKDDVGITKVEVVAIGECDVLKFEVHHTSALHNCAKRTTS